MSNNKKCHKPEPITQSTPCRTLTHSSHKQTHTYKVYLCRQTHILKGKPKFLFHYMETSNIDIAVNTAKAGKKKKKKQQSFLPISN